jgi:hypothetical protein
LLLGNSLISKASLWDAMAVNNIKVVSEMYIHKSGIYKRNFIYVEFVSRINLISSAVVRKQTIPTERSPLVGEVSAKLCG